MSTTRSPFNIVNIRLFIIFRVLFNARFYYPVFTILFLDFGLTIEQFALLNTVWAVTIVLAEVPSGAMADILGRKYLMVMTSLFMVAEMSLLAFIPLGNTKLIFWAFLVNRILSGLAEAMSSGADEAIAYDSLVAEGDPDDWPKVLSMQMRLRSFASILTMTLGALIYDPDIINRLLGWAGFSIHVNQQISMRFPIYFTLILAILAVITTLGMEEEKEDKTDPSDFNISGAFKLTLQAGIWITRTPFAITIILFGMCLDHILRMIITMSSQYFRLIDLPEASFGLIGSALAVLGLITPKIAEYMAKNNSASINLYWVTAISLAGLFGLSGFFPYFGLLPMALIFIAITFVSFFTSHYLNQITESSQRATVLSFKGMAFNLAYGLIGFLFALLIKNIRADKQLIRPEWSASVIENITFKDAVAWFPWYTIICLGIIAVFCIYQLKIRTTPPNLPIT